MEKGMTVYVLLSATDPQEGYIIQGVYDDPALAERAKQARNAKIESAHASQRSYKGRILEIEEWVVNAQTPEEFA